MSQRIGDAKNFAIAVTLIVLQSGLLAVAFTQWSIVGLIAVAAVSLAVSTHHGLSTRLLQAVVIIALGWAVSGPLGVAVILVVMWRQHSLETTLWGAALWGVVLMGPLGAIAALGAYLLVLPTLITWEHEVNGDRHALANSFLDKVVKTLSNESGQPLPEVYRSNHTDSASARYVRGRCAEILVSRSMASDTRHLAALLAHEFGHLTSRWTHWSFAAGRLLVSIGVMGLTSQAEALPLWLNVLLAAALLTMQVLAWLLMRNEEYAADDYAATRGLADQLADYLKVKDAEFQRNLNKTQTDKRLALKLMRLLDYHPASAKRIARLHQHDTPDAVAMEAVLAPLAAWREKHQFTPAFE